MKEPKFKVGDKVKISNFVFTTTIDKVLYENDLS